MGDGDGRREEEDMEKRMGGERIAEGDMWREDGRGHVEGGWEGTRGGRRGHGEGEDTRGGYTQVQMIETRLHEEVNSPRGSCSNHICAGTLRCVCVFVLNDARKRVRLIRPL